MNVEDKGKPPIVGLIFLELNLSVEITTKSKPASLVIMLTNFVSDSISAWRSRVISKSRASSAEAYPEKQNSV